MNAKNELKIRIPIRVVGLNASVLNEYHESHHTKKIQRASDKF